MKHLSGNHAILRVVKELSSERPQSTIRRKYQIVSIYLRSFCTEMSDRERGWQRLSGIYASPDWTRGMLNCLTVPTPSGFVTTGGEPPRVPESGRSARNADKP
jgi:hypothetical protein